MSYPTTTHNQIIRDAVRTHWNDGENCILVVNGVPCVATKHGQVLWAASKEEILSLPDHEYYTNGVVNVR